MPLPTTPTVTYAEWLQAEALFSEAASAPVAAAWGDDATSSETIGPLAYLAAADAESARQLAFFGQPMAVDLHEMVGRFAPYIGKTITIKGPRLDYDAGVDVFVLGAIDNLSLNVSQVTVLRRI